MSVTIWRNIKAAWHLFETLPERVAEWLEENNVIEAERECGS